MKSKRAQNKSRRAASRLHRHEAEGAAVGALGGAGLGIMAGPPGIAAGAVIGAVAGTLTAWAQDSNSADVEANDERLDATIGVSGGDLGVPDLEHPPAIRGAYSAASMGAKASEGETTLAEGPFLPPPK
jgi:hypothetical protein